MSFHAPAKDMLFVMNKLGDIEGISALPGFEDASLDTACAALEVAARFNGEVVVVSIPYPKSLITSGPAVTVLAN